MPIGKVEKVEGKIATVSIERQDMCGECHACEIVGEVKKCTIKCQNLCESTLGESVEIELENSTFLKATALMYGMPLIGLLAGLGLGLLVPSGLDEQVREVAMAIFALVGMGAGLLWLKKKDSRRKYDELLPRAVKVIRK